MALLRHSALEQRRSLIFTFKSASAFEQGHLNADNPTHVLAYAKRCNIISYAYHLKG